MPNDATIPDPQLEGILDVLRALLAATTVGTGDSASSLGLDAVVTILGEVRGIVVAIFDAVRQPDAVVTILGDIRGVLVAIFDAVRQASSIGQPGNPSDPQSGQEKGSTQLAAILDELRKIYHTRTAVTAPTPPSADADGGGIGDVLGTIGQVIAGITALLATLLGAVAIVQQFTGALDPGLVDQFHRAIRDLQATIGVAFTGVFEQGLNFLRDLSAAIQPVFAALKPVVDQLVSTVLKGFESSLAAATPVLLAVVPLLKLVVELFALLSAMLRPILALFTLFTQAITSTLGAVFTLLAAALEPVVKLLDAFADGLQDVITLFSVIMRVLFDMLNAFVSSLFAGGFEELVKGVTNAFKELTQIVLLAAAKLALMAGSDGFAKRMLDALSQSGQAATGSTSIKGLEQIGKDMAIASVNAAGVADPNDAWRARAKNKLTQLLIENRKHSDSIASAFVRRVTGSDTAADLTQVALDPVGYLSPF